MPRHTEDVHIMAVYDNVVSGILLVAFTAVVIVTGVIAYNNSLQSVKENSLHEQKYDAVDNAISTMLVTTEPNYGFQFTRILGLFFYQGSNQIETSYGTMKVNETLEPMLDHFLGRGKYHIEAYPVISDLRLHFIVDGSDSMVAMRDYLENEMPLFLSQLRQDKGFDVFATVYILSDDESLCDDFTQMECKTLTMSDLYGVVPGITDPYRGVRLSIDPLTYAVSDWASAIAVIANENQVHKESRLEMIIPIADEVNLGSKDDSCYTMPNNDYYQSLALIKCLFCNTITDYSTSWYTVNRVKPIVEDSHHLICPMNAMRARYEERQVVRDYLSEQLGRGPDDSVPSTFCGDSECQACIDLENCNEYSVCSSGNNCPGCGTDTGDVAFWHPEAYDVFNEQLWYFANLTGGANFTIRQFHDISEYIEDVIEDYIKDRLFELGDEPQAEYMAFHRVVPNPLANDANMEIQIKYHESSVYDNESALPDVRPVLLDFNLVQIGPTEFIFNCTLRDDDEIIKSMLLFDGEVDSHESVLELVSRTAEGRRIYQAFRLSFTNEDFLSTFYNLSLRVQDENSNIYLIKDFYVDFEGLGYCACDTSLLCEDGCQCDPNCGGLPPKFFWNNYGGIAWNTDDGVDYMTGVRNQGGCGSCWAFAVVGSSEGKHNVERNITGDVINLAEQDLVSCASETSSGLLGCNGAIPSLGGMSDAEAYLISPGIRTEFNYPYETDDPPCTPGPAEYKVGSWSYVPSASRNAIKRHLVEDGPLVTVIHMDDRTGGWKYRRDGTCPVVGIPDHAVVIVGYDTEGWIIRNSWGPINSYNHHDGYFKVRYGECSINRNYYPDYPNDVHEI